MDDLYENLKYKNIADVKERIDKNDQFMKELEKLIVCQENELDILRLIELIGFLYSEYLTGKYASKELEQEIISIGNRMIKFSRERQPKKNHILIVMTESSAVGGHSVLANNWMRWDTKNQYSVALTGQGYDEVVDFIKESVGISGGKIFCLSGDYVLKAKNLLEISQDFEKVLLFTHMYDVVPTLAYGNNNWTIPVLFYNHADFKFSLGISIADKVLNLCPYDRERTERFQGVPNEKSVVMRFPNGGQIVKCERKTECIENKNEKKVQRHLLAERFGFDEDEKLIVSAGSDFKYENILGYSFTQFVQALLDEYDDKASFLIIGADKERDKWKKLYERTGGKGRAMGVLPRKEMDVLIEAADLYILSFPMPGTGGMIAERAKVPYLALFITERGMDVYTHNAARTVDELKEKALDVLSGNREMYLGHMLENYETQEEWQHKWENILASVKEHSVMEICPKRYIETREYVNCQLMQDMASDHAAKFLYCRGLNEQLREHIVYLDNKYGMNIFHRIEILEKNIEISKKNWEISNCASYSDKHLKLFLTAIEWLQIKQCGKSIEVYLLDKGYHSIAIYGMSYMGEILLRDIDQKKVKIKYGIDTKADKIHMGIPVYFPGECLPVVDAMINTTTLNNDIILAGLKCKDIELLALTQIIERLM